LVATCRYERGLTGPSHCWARRRLSEVEVEVVEYLVDVVQGEGDDLRPGTVVSVERVVQERQLLLDVAAHGGRRWQRQGLKKPELYPANDRCSTSTGWICR
jgi:hypothetical protein